jgi:hypothetical protein
MPEVFVSTTILPLDDTVRFEYGYNRSVERNETATIKDDGKISVAVTNKSTGPKRTLDVSIIRSSVIFTALYSQFKYGSFIHPRIQSSSMLKGAFCLCAGAAIVWELTNWIFGSLTTYEKIDGKKVLKNEYHLVTVSENGLRFFHKTKKELPVIDSELQKLEE